MHLLTAHIDDLTVEASAPLDRLVDISLQANRTSGQAKQHLLSRFETKATFLNKQLELVERLFNEATGDISHPEKSIVSGKAALGFLKKLTPHAVGAAKFLASMCRKFLL